MINIRQQAQAAMNNQSPLFLSTSFKDIQNNEIVGTISENHWSLFKPNLLNYQNTDSGLVVIDRGGNIIFKINFGLLNILNVDGYFVGIKNVAVLFD